MITAALLWPWAGENGSWHFITVREEFSGEICADGMAALRASDRFASKPRSTT
jgi:hypothetical protein